MRGASERLQKQIAERDEKLKTEMLGACTPQVALSGQRLWALLGCSTPEVLSDWGEADPALVRELPWWPTLASVLLTPPRLVHTPLSRRKAEGVREHHLGQVWAELGQLSDAKGPCHWLLQHKLQAVDRSFSWEMPAM